MNRSLGLSTTGLLVLWFVIFSPPTGSAGPMTEEQGEAILNELKQIRLLLDQQVRQTGVNLPPAIPSPQRATIQVNSAYTLGREDAPLTLVEFTDYQCPFCRDFHMTTFEQLKKTYIEAGTLRFISRDLPLEFHPHASKAAQAARCAGEHGKYWEARHLFILNAQTLSPEMITTLVNDLGIDSAQFQACLESERYKQAVLEDTTAARSAAITGTPTFVLGRTANGTLEGPLIIGAQPFETFDAKIKELLPSEQ